MKPNEHLVSGGSPSFAAPQNTPQPPTPQPCPAAGVPGQIGQSVPLGAPVYWQPAKKVKEPFHATVADGWFALWCVALGYLWIRWVTAPLFSGFLGGWGCGIFTLLFAAGVLWYAHAKGVKAKAESWFWLAMLLGCAVSFCLWPGVIMAPMRLLLWVFSAFWWCGSLFGSLLAGKTGNWALLDGLNLLVFIPCKNIGMLLRGLRPFLGEEKQNTGEQTEENKKAENTQKIREKIGKKNILAVLLGLGLCIPVLLCVLPLLAVADSGNFTQLGQTMLDWLSRFFKDPFYVYLWQFVFGLPVALYLFGLAGGAAHKRCVGSLDIKKAERDKTLARVLPRVSVLLVLVAVSLLYALFIGCQIPYYFSAFSGRLPQGVEVYSQYAREGFFELCRVAAINLGILAGAACLCRSQMADSRLLRVFTLVLNGLTVLLVLTALSKMLLYIGVYGLTPKRIQTTVFMVFLLLLCGAVALAVFRKISVVRFGLMAGSVLVCLLCLVNLDGLAMQYNAARYSAGSAESVSGFGLWGKADNSSANAALAMYQAAERKKKAAASYEELTVLEEEQEELGRYLEQSYRRAQAQSGSPVDTVATWQLRQNTAVAQLVQQREEEADRQNTAWCLAELYEEQQMEYWYNQGYLRSVPSRKYHDPISR